MVQASLYEEIGRLKMELDWVKKLRVSAEEKRRWIDPGHPELSIRRQCALLGLSRASFYYESAQESPEDLALMRRIDAQYTRTPFYGSRRMTVSLYEQGYGVNRKRVQRLMRRMGLWGIAPGPRTSRAHPAHRVYPYLLRDLVVERPNQVWSTDITYIPMRAGFMFLVAILNWYSRYVLSWGLSNTLDTVFCLEALEEALSAGRPEIFRAASSPVRRSPVCSRRTRCGSAWTAAGGSSTTSLSSAFGVRSSTRTSTSGTTPTSATQPRFCRFQPHLVL